jgi:HPt (histidine-containing phosphotransfer) domain-containing protein
MGLDDVIAEFRPIFRAELRERVQQIRDALQPQRKGVSPAGLETAFREAHNIAGTAGYLDAQDLATAARSLVAIARPIIEDARDATDVELKEAWSAYEQIETAARRFLDQEPEAGGSEHGDAG